MNVPWGFGLGAIVLIVLAGVPPVLARATTPATIAEGIAQGVRWLAMFLVLAFVVPGFKKVFDDFGVKLPFLTGIVIQASDTAAVWMPGMLLGGAAVTWLFYWLYRDPAKRGMAKGLSMVCTTIAAGSVFVVLAAQNVPLSALLHDLNRTE